jgi:hypothetical protein
MRLPHPYSDIPARASWKRGVAADHVTQITGLFDGVPGLAKAQVATGGSCFAQHIGRELRSRGLRYMDYEPAPPVLSAAAADELGYGVYSCRYGNIYTTRQLVQLFDEAFGLRQPCDIIWTRDGRFYDALRPGVERNGFSSANEVMALRASHLARVKALFSKLDIFVFTLGLTEAWCSEQDGTVYPVAPGVIAGTYDPARHCFKNFRYNEVHADLVRFIEALRRVNSTARLILTVSPVPLAATAMDQHVLVSTTYSKSVLRSVAGDLAQDIDGVYYFPSYEIITGQPTRHMYYNPDLRTVCARGVEEVMRHFFAQDGRPIVAKSAAPATTGKAQSEDENSVGFEHCEEALLDGGAS